MPAGSETSVVGGGVSLVVADGSGGLVVSVESLVVREVSSEQFAVSGSAYRDSLFGVDWVEVSFAAGFVVDEVVLLGCEGSVIAESLSGAGCSVQVYADLEALGGVVGEDGVVPGVVLVDLGEGDRMHDV